MVCPVARHTLLDVLYEFCSTIVRVSLAVVDRMNRRVVQTQAIASETSSELQRQGEQLEQANRDLDHIEVNLKRAGKKLNEIIRGIACDKLIMFCACYRPNLFSVVVVVTFIAFFFSVFLFSFSLAFVFWNNSGFMTLAASK